MEERELFERHAGYKSLVINSVVRLQVTRYYSQYRYHLTHKIFRAQNLH